MARVDAEHRLIACFFPLENAGAPFAFPTLTFRRYRREHFRRIEFVKLVDQNAIRDRLCQRFENGGVDRWVLPARAPAKQEDYRRPSLTISMTCMGFGANLSAFLSGQKQGEKPFKTGT